MKQTDHVSGHVFIKKYQLKLAEFSQYAHREFLKHGKGVLIVDETTAGSPEYRYSTEGETDEYFVNFGDYKPPRHVYFVWKRRDYPVECFVYDRQVSFFKN